jgi:hypothetical protein
MEIVVDIGSGRELRLELPRHNPGHCAVSQHSVMTPVSMRKEGSILSRFGALGRPPAPQQMHIAFSCTCICKKVREMGG